MDILTRKSCDLFNDLFLFSTKLIKRENLHYVEMFSELF